MSVFVDTSVRYAAAHSSDVSNVRAVELLSTAEPLVTSDHVLVETWRLIHQFLSPRAADKFRDGLRMAFVVFG